MVLCCLLEKSLPQRLINSSPTVAEVLELMLTFSQSQQQQQESVMRVSFRVRLVANQGGVVLFGNRANCVLYDCYQML